jgi:hypothetical protein
VSGHALFIDQQQPFIGKNIDIPDQFESDLDLFIFHKKVVVLLLDIVIIHFSGITE